MSLPNLSLLNYFEILGICAFQTLKVPVLGFQGLGFWDSGFGVSGLGFSFVINCLLRRWEGPLESTCSPSGVCVCFFLKDIYIRACVRTYVHKCARVRECESARVRECASARK